MHRFNRGEPPVEFKKISRKYKTWEEFARDDRDAHSKIREALYERQQRFCAYCERKIESRKGKKDDYVCLEGHIEHLERRADVPKRIFDWENLFLSCDHSDSCGKFKDALKGDERSFNIADVINPSVENPLDYFDFDKDDGTISYDSKATPEIKRKVKETIRIFNLNCPKLMETRLRAIEVANNYLDLLPTDEDIEDYLERLSDDTPCISVYYAVFGKRPEYEARFASKSSTNDRAV